MARIYDTDILNPRLPEYEGYDQPIPQKQGYLPVDDTRTLLGAGLKAESLPAAYLSSKVISSTAPQEEGFNVYEELKARGKQDYYYAFKVDDNKEVFESKLNQIAAEEEYEEILNRNGNWGTASRIIGSLANPDILAAGFSAPTKIGRALTIGEKVVGGGVALGGTVYGQERLKEQYKLTQNVDQANHYAISAAIIGGAISGVAGKFQQHTVDNAVNDVNRAIKGQGPEMPKVTEAELQKSMGAAEINYADQASEWNPKNLPEWSTSLSTLTRSPQMLMFNNKLGTTKELASRLYKHNLRLNRSEWNLANPVSLEAKLTMDAQHFTSAVDDVATENYYKLAGISGPLKQERATLQNITKRGYTPNQFAEDVALAMRRGGDSEIPEIAASAKLYNATIDEWTNKLVKTGILGQDEIDAAAPTHLKNYLSRVYNQPKIRAEKAELRDKIIQHYKGKYKELDEDAVVYKADQTLDSIMGIADEDSAFEPFLKQFAEGKVNPAFLKERLVDLPDEVLEPWLINDGPSLTRRYVRNSSLLLNIKELFDDMGVTSWKGIEKKMKEEYLASSAQRGLKDKELTDAIEISKRNFEALTGISHHKTPFDAGLRTINKHILNTTMGALTLTSGADLVMAPLRHGWGNTIQQGIVPVLKGIKDAKLSKQQLNDFIVGMNASNGDTINRMLGVGENTLAKRGPIEQSFDVGVNTLMKANFFEYYNAGNRSFHARLSQAHTITALKSGSKKEQQRLLDLGIDTEAGKIILDQTKKHGDEVNGSYLPNMDRWDNTPAVNDAKRKFQNSISIDVDQGIIQPGAGDVPVTMQNYQGAKVIGLFKSFLMASSNKVGYAAINKADAKTAVGIFQLISAGALVYGLKELYAGREPDLSAGNLVMQGLLASGAGGIIADIPLSTLSKDSRFIKDDIYGKIGGPAISIYGRAAASGIRAIKGEKLTRDDYDAAKRMIPYNNLLWFKPFFKDAKKK